MRFILAAAALLGFTATLMGALGAHNGAIAEAVAQASWTSSVTFGLAHAVAAIGVLACRSRLRMAWLPAAGFTLGGWLFAGAIWIKPLTYALGFIAPIGGSMIMLSWIGLAVLAVLGWSENQVR